MAPALKLPISPFVGEMSAKPTEGGAVLPTSRSCTPPSGLPAISPTKGEIGRCGVAAIVTDASADRLGRPEPRETRVVPLAAFAGVPSCHRYDEFARGEPAAHPARGCTQPRHVFCGQVGTEPHFLSALVGRPVAQTGNRLLRSDYFRRDGSPFVSPRPGLGIRSTVVVLGRRSASLTGMNCPLFELRPMSKVLRFAAIGIFLSMAIAPPLPRLRNPTPHMVTLLQERSSGLFAPRELRLVRGFQSRSIRVGFGISGMPHKGIFMCFCFVPFAISARSQDRAERVTFPFLEKPQLHPLVAPQVSHFSQVPFRTMVKFWHSEHMLPV